MHDTPLLPCDLFFLFRSTVFFLTHPNFFLSLSSLLHHGYKRDDWGKTSQERGQRNNGKSTVRNPQVTHNLSKRRKPKRGTKKRGIWQCCTYVCMCVSDERQLSEIEATGVWDTVLKPVHSVMNQLYYCYIWQHYIGYCRSPIWLKIQCLHRSYIHNIRENKMYRSIYWHLLS